MNTVPADLATITELYLLPASILAASLAAAKSEGLKFGLSLVSLLVAALWTLAVWWTFPDWKHLAQTTLKLLPVIFLLFAVVASWIHGEGWYEGLPAESLSKDDLNPPV